MKKLIVTAIIALASTSALAFDSRFDAQEYYTGQEHSSDSTAAHVTGPVELDNSISSVLAAEGIWNYKGFEDRGVAPPKGDIVIGNTIADILAAEGAEGIVL